MTLFQLSELSITNLIVLLLIVNPSDNWNFSFAERIKDYGNVRFLDCPHCISMRHNCQPMERIGTSHSLNNEVARIYETIGHFKFRDSASALGVFAHVRKNA